MSRLPQTTQLIFKIVRSFCQLRIETLSAVTVFKDAAALLWQGAPTDTWRHGYLISMSSNIPSGTWLSGIFNKSGGSKEENQTNLIHLVKTCFRGDLRGEAGEQTKFL